MSGDDPIARARTAVRTLVRSTSDDRDRVVDALRAASIVVVVLWHWTLSITHRDADGRLVNPNPIADVPLGWLPTWVLQVMPVFFLVGGFANRAGWCSVTSSGGGAVAFLAGRARRLLAPTLVFLAVWAAIDGVAHLVVDGHRSVFVTASIVFVPLWFVAAYAWVVLLVPLTARWHDRAPRVTIGILVLAVLAADVTRFGIGLDAAGWVNTALVWVLVHQLGYLWHDGALRDRPRRDLVAVVIVGLVGLAITTSLDSLPRSMVGTGGEPSHMYPTTGAIVLLALVQLGLILLLRPSLGRWLRRTGPWSAVVAVNAVIMTIFVWHMTALYLVVIGAEAVGIELGDSPSAAWWLARPVWIILPAVVLVPLVAVFARVETGRTDR